MTTQTTFCSSCGSALNQDNVCRTDYCAKYGQRQPIRPSVQILFNEGDTVQFTDPLDPTRVQTGTVICADANEAVVSAGGSFAYINTEDMQLA